MTSVGYKMEKDKPLMAGYAVSIRVLPLSVLAFFIVFMLFTKFCKPTQKLK